MGFTQRQGNGKFTRDEADAFIAQLQAEAEGEAVIDETGVTPPAPPRGPVTAAQRRAATQARDIARMPSDLLAAELQRRGWAVIEP